MKPSKNSTSLIFSIFVAFLGIVILGELGLRARDFLHLEPSNDTLFTTDPVLPFKMKPFLKFRERSETGEFVNTVETNSAGFRDAEHACKKNAGAFRIFAMGDSFAFGGGVELRESCLYVLETMLNQRAGSHPRVEIIKAGIPRFYPETERLLLDHYGKKYDPDLILVFFPPNDIADTHVGMDAVALEDTGLLTRREARWLGKTGSFLYNASFICRYLLKKYITWKEERHSPWKKAWKEIYTANGFFEKDWQSVESEYQKMAKTAAQLKARIVFVHIPQQGPWKEHHFYPAQRLSAFATKHGAEFVDLLPDMIEASKNETLFYRQDGHYNARGYSIMARRLYTHLTDNRLIP